jgi:hypothetical protein
MSLITSPQDEAIGLLGEVIANLTSTNKDLKSVLRKCQLVCELLGWEQQKQWIHQELNGYYKGANLPSYRIISGIRKWDVGKSGHDSITWVSESIAYGVDSQIYEEEPDTLEVYAGIDWFISVSPAGYRDVLKETKVVTTPSKKDNVTLHRVRIFGSPAITWGLSQIEKAIYDFASSAYVQLKYSNVIKHIWDGYQIKVDKVISQLGLTQHLSAIENNLLSKNPEEWRVATFECRNLVNDLANYLWRDPRNRYEYLPGNTDDGKLDVSLGKFGNRLSAYLHQKGITGTQGKYLRDEASRLSASIQSLISFQSEAHEPMSHLNARSIAIAMYILIAEIVTRTDLTPIESYQKSAIVDENSS